MGIKADQMAKFIRGLGYHAVSAGNDLGNSVAYAIMAGLGEGGRNGQLLAPGVGPRVRIAKIYTDFDFVEYDEPRSWGIEDYCLSCLPILHRKAHGDEGCCRPVQSFGFLQNSYDTPLSWGKARCPGVLIVSVKH